MLMRFRDKLSAQLVENLHVEKLVRVNLLQKFLDAMMEDGKPLDLDYTKAEILPVLLAGAGTTDATFQAMIDYISFDAKVFAKLMEEIDSVGEDRKLSPMPQYDGVVEHCPYYIARVMETMRRVN